MKTKLFWTLALSILQLSIYGQITENFEAWNSASWTISRPTAFYTSSTSTISGTYTLQHSGDATAAYDNMSISLGGIDPTVGDMSWQFQIKHTNTASSTNGWIVFLYADADASQMLNSGGNINGYALGVNTGSTFDDIVKLYSVTNGSYTSILASSLNWDTGRTSTNDTLGVRITRSMAGEWEVFFDTQSGGFNNLVSVGTTTNTTHTNAAYFGVLYKYTSANIRKFWFDDLSITGTISTSAITANTAAIPAASLPQNAQNIVVGGFRISVTGKNTTLNEVNFIPSGTFGSDDITNLQLWYSSDSIFDASDVLLDETTNIVSGSPISFSGLSKIFSKNNTAYILITADVDPHAIANHTFFFENTVPGDLVFSEGSLTENYVASNTFTIEDVVVETLELTTGFENSDLWTDFSYSDFTVNSVQGVWTGKGISASSTFKYTGLRGVSFNTLGDYLEFPPINNPGKIEFDSKLSSDGTADLNRLAVQVLIGANWVNIHDIQQSTSTWQHNTIYIHQKGTNLRLRLYKNSYEKTQYIDNIIVKSIEHAYDTSSIAEVPVNQPVSQNISSLKDTPVEAIHVFSFNLTDNALTDTKSTKIRMLEIRNKKPVGTAIWDATIQGVRLYADGNEIVTSSLLVSDTSLLISFVNDDLVINSGQTRELDLYIYLKDTGIEKGATLQFCIPATGFSFASDTSGSAFNTSIPAEIVSEIHTLSVIGSQLQILSQTQQTGLSSPFGIKTAITDVNGNIDTAASGQISLGLLSGASGILTSALNPLLNLPTNNGIAEWTDLAYNTFDTIQLQVNTNIAGITTITSLPIVIGDVDSEIGAPTVQIASQDVSSVADSVHEKVPIFRFNVTDTGASGGVSTFIQEFYFKNTMPYNGADWTNSIQGAVIEDGDSVYFPSDVVINDNYLKLTYTTPIEIENDSNKDFELAIYLNKSKIIDNSRIQFYIDSVDYNWKAIQGSALLDILPAKVFSNISTLRVISDTLLFANVPDTAYTNTYFSADITATDKNLNIDTDADALVTLSQCVGTDLLAAGEGLVKRLSSGVFQWRYLLLDSPGERGLSASASGYKTGLTDTFIVLGENLSDILPALSPIGNQNISSLADSRTEATEVFRFRVSDAGLNDDATTSVTKMRFVPGSANSANWTLNVADAFIMHNADTLVHSIISIHDDALIFEFTDFPVEIPSGQTEAFSLYIVLKSNGIQDGKTLQFKIPSVYHEWDTELYTSIFRTNLSADVISPESLIDVIGNQIAILNKPNFIPVDSSFSLSVSYTDANLNLDEDAVEQISISKASLGAGNFEIEIPYTSSINFENGIANFQGLRYNTQDTLSLNFSTFSGTSLNEQVFICGKFYLDENFNLGNFNKWNSDTTEWIIPNTANPYAKHGLSNVAGKSHLATNLFGYVQGNGLTHWEFSIYTGNWNPSSLNKFNFFLLADNTNLELAQNGFAFGINNHNTSGLLSLIELKDGISTLLFETNYTWQVSDSVNFQIEYNPVGIWKLQYKAKNDTEWNTIENIRGKITDDFAATGLLFEYTSTRAGYLGLDDLKVIQINYPPALLEVKANALDTVKLIFSEKLLESDAENIAHYTIKNFDNDIISVNQVVLNPTNEKEITLITDSLGYTPLELIISQISDIESTLAYNIIDTFSLPYRPMAHDVVFNEIMADPDPEVGLPPVEYLELRNNSSYDISLNGWSLVVGSSVKSFGNVTISANDFLIVTNTSGADTLDFYGQVVAMLGSSDLTNAGNTLVLRNELGDTIDILTYSSAMYRDAVKDDGGYSLERRNPMNFCATDMNWAASASTLGGTPGSANSVEDGYIDAVSPIIQSFAAKVNSVDIFMSEKVDTALISSSLFNLLPGNILASALVKENEKITLNFTNNFTQGTAYTLNITGLQDVCENVMNDTSLTFSFYLPVAHDVVFNEIMEDPDPEVGLPPLEYLELYNNSSYDISLNGWSLAVGSSVKTFGNVNIPAGGFLIVTNTSGADTLDFYGQAIGILGSSDLTNAGNTLVLINELGDTIDILTYSSAMYRDAVKDDGGYSLERRNPLNFCATDMNWSASVAALGGTPGSANSVNDGYVDVVLPAVQSFVVNENSVEIFINEKVDTAVVVNSLFNLLPDNAFPISLTKQSDKISINFANNFTQGTAYTLNVSGINDVCGNVMDDTSLTFSFYLPVAHDVVFNEIMADPDPEVGLPPVEYLELYNNSAYDISLSGWSLEVGSSVKNLGNVNIPANDYLIITNSIGADTLDYYGQVVAMLGSTDLTNAGNTLVLRNELGDTIDILTYSSAMYRDAVKDDGGYSLERRNPLNFCATDMNWSASVAALGGTPGTANSVNDGYVDVVLPNLLGLKLIDSITIVLTFSEKIQLPSTQDIFIQPSNESPVLIELFGSEQTQLKMTFGSAFKQKNEYELFISNIRDLCGNSSMSQSANFVYYDAIPGDIIFSEIMADANPSHGLPQYEYIELFNKTEFPIELNGFTVFVNNQANKLEGGKIAAGGFIIVCDEQAVQAFSNGSNVIGVKSFTGVPNDGAYLSIANGKGRSIDIFEYSPELYMNTSLDDGGISLEKVDITIACDLPSFWKPSEHFLGGTPGFLNSVNGVSNLSEKLLVDQIHALNSKTVLIQFNQAVTDESALVSEHYEFLSPQSISSMNISGNKNITLTVQNNFNSSAPNFVRVKNIESWCNQTLSDTLLSFAYNKIQVNRLDAVSTTEIHILFSEPTDKQSATRVQNYLLNDVSYPNAAYFEDDSLTNLILQFADEIPVNMSNALKISQVFDSNSTNKIDTTISFKYNQIQWYDLIINEIMFDPIGAPELPETEYLELYNRSENSLNTYGLVLTIGSTSYTLPNLNVPAHSYLIVCNADNANLLARYGNVCGIKDLGILSDTKQTITLSDRFGNLIYGIEYASAWITDENKKNGGWSLELINSDSPSYTQEFWQVSIDKSGGTPGRVNSKKTDITDTTPPEAVKLATVDANTLLFFFTEMIQPETLLDVNNYIFTESNVQISSLWPNDALNTSVQINLKENILPDKIYKLLISNMFDASGNKSLDTDTLLFGLPEMALAGDLVINEVLAYPNTGGTDYIEIFNRSNKILATQSLYLKIGEGEDISENIYISETNYPILPGEYLVLSKNDQEVIPFYPRNNPLVFMNVANLPSINQESEIIVLKNELQETVDSFAYSSELHTPLLRTQKGISLERISSELPSNDPNNWFSASEMAGGGTPGLINSQFYLPGLSSESDFTLNKEIFSPDGDGRDDFLTIEYKLKNPGNIANIFVFSHLGRKVANICKNTLLESSGIITWDGTDIDGNTLPIGIYILYIQVYDLDGKISDQKLTVVISGKR